MTALVLRRIGPLWTRERRFATANAIATVCCYVALYVALDWISFIRALPGTGYTPWSPVPALSLALLIGKGLWFAPAVFAAELISSNVVEHFPAGGAASLASAAIVASGYTATAALLRRIPPLTRRPIRPRVVAGFLAITAGGALGVAVADVNVIVALGGLPSSLVGSSIRNSFIGDLTGIIGLLPALLTWRKAWERWKEITLAARVNDIGVFVVGLGGAALLLAFDNAHEKELQLFYLMLPPVIWIAVRHGLAWCAAAILVDQLALIATLVLLGFSSNDFLSCQLLSIVISATGLILGAVVTQRNHAEQLLRHQQAELARHARLTTVGAFGAAVVHEISQPLAAAAAFAHSSKRLLEEKPFNAELLRETVENVGQETHRAGAIVERIRHFLDRRELRWDSIDLGEVLRRLGGALADEARAHGVAIRVSAPTSTLVDADRIQMEQVLVNLMRNAIEAAADSEVGEGSVQTTLSRSPGAIRIEVEDNGPGVAPDIVERLFEPFETTKRRGMGLGLSLSREIVKAHGGRLWLDRTDATGSKFVVELPDKSGAPL
jgi:two-component system, LuxR family, sensor kinase FixL